MAPRNDDEYPDDSQIELMAVAVHEQYLVDNGGTARPGHPAMVPWDDLDDRLRQQNRDQVRQNVHRVRSAGYEVEPLRTAPPNRVVESFPDEFVERLARTEHERWAQKKRAQGYRYGETRHDTEDGPGLRHPDLKPWHEMDESERDKDRRPIRDVPRVLAIGGWAVLDPRSGEVP